MRLNKIIKRKRNNDSRQTCYHDLKPQDPFVLITVALNKIQNYLRPFRLLSDGHLSSSGKLLYVKRPQLIPVQNNDCENCSQLDHNQKYIHKILRNIQVNKLIHQDHMAGTADRKPLCNSFHNTKENYL